MKKRKHPHLTAAFLAALALLGLGARTVCADLMGSVTATFIYADGTGHAADGTVLCYQPASLTRDENGTEAYTYTEAFKECPISLDSLDDETNHDLAASLAAWISEQEEITGTACDVEEEGSVAITDLEAGLYLFMLQEGSTTSYAFDPFLVSIPFEGNYEVDASPKVEVKSLAPATTPPAVSTPTAAPTLSPAPGGSPTQTPPSDASGTPKQEKAASTLPQTGQLNWPIPLLTGGGLLFLLIGALLQRTGRRKKAEDET